MTPEAPPDPRPSEPQTAQGPEVLSEQKGAPSQGCSPDSLWRRWEPTRAQPCSAQTGPGQKILTLSFLWLPKMTRAQLPQRRRVGPPAPWEQKHGVVCQEGPRGCTKPPCSSVCLDSWELPQGARDYAVSHPEPRTCPGGLQREAQGLRAGCRCPGLSVLRLKSLLNKTGP